MKIMAFFVLFLSSCCLFLNVQHSHIFLFYVIFLWLFLSACFPYMTGTMGMYQECHCCIVFPLSCLSVFWDPGGFLSPHFTPK